MRAGRFLASGYGRRIQSVHMETTVMRLTIGDAEFRSGCVFRGKTNTRFDSAELTLEVARSEISSRAVSVNGN